MHCVYLGSPKVLVVLKDACIPKRFGFGVEKGTAWRHCCRFSRYIGWVTRKIKHLCGTKERFLGNRIPKSFHLVLKTKSLTLAGTGGF